MLSVMAVVVAPSSERNRDRDAGRLGTVSVISVSPVVNALVTWRARGAILERQHFTTGDTEVTEERHRLLALQDPECFP